MRLGIILIFFLFFSYSLRLNIIIIINLIWIKFLLFFPVAIILLISCVAETNRTPFDFAEGESELVSGFNIEYGRLGFAMIFIAEYASILFLRCLFVFIFFSSSCLFLYIYIIIILLFRFWVWIRTTFPRYHYDKLINLTWKNYLPNSIILIFYIIIIMLI